MTSRSWTVHAGGSNVERGPTVYGTEFYVRLHMFPHTWVGELVEDPEGELRGWFRTDDDQFFPPSMVHHHRVFPVCFPYGVQSEVDAGKGTVVFLRWVPAERLGE